MIVGAERDEAAVLAQIQSAGAPFRRLVFTENRRVMISAGRDRDTLRLHRSFASAPPAVLRAVGQWFAARGKRERGEARRVLQAFLASVPAAPPQPRRRRIPAADRPLLDRLRAEFEHVNAAYFGGSLPAVPLFLSGRMRRRNGHFSAAPPEIVLARRLCTDALPGEAEQTLRHEMIHLWQHVNGHRPGHGRDFRGWARRLGVHPRACRTVAWNDAGPCRAASTA